MAKPPRNRNVTEPQHREIQQRLEDAALGIVGSGTLGNLTDVTITGAATGEILVYDGSQWVNDTYALDDLSDVTIGTPGTNQIIGWNGSAWINRTIDLDALSDVATSSESDNDVLMFNFGLGQWENAQMVISDLSDVNTAGATSGQFLRYDGADWVDDTVTLNDISDVSVAGPSAGQVLEWSGAAWAAATRVLDDNNDVTISGATSGQHLEYNGSAWVNATPSTGSSEGLLVISGNANQALTTSVTTFKWGTDTYDRNGDFSYNNSTGVITLPASTKVLIEWTMHLDDPNADDDTNDADWTRIGWLASSTAGGTYSSVSSVVPNKYFWSPRDTPDTGMTVPGWSESGSFVYDTASNDRFIRMDKLSNSSGCQIDAVANGAVLKITILD